MVYNNDQYNGYQRSSIRNVSSQSNSQLIIKEGFGWSDEALFEAVRFNLIIRRALGLFNMTDAVLVESTYYLFKQHLYRYQVENGVNQLDEIFWELTRGQIRRLGVIGDRLRMDTQTKHE